MKPLSDITAPDLVKEWKHIVNDYVMIGRDAHLMKESLNIFTVAQILLGIYQYAGNRSITIPRFLSSHEEWIERDEEWAKIELAREFSKTTPKEYLLYQDLCEEENSQAFMTSLEARLWLRDWAERILN
jgi:hypothetical protein